ncbi:DUF6765 family protein [Clostridioides difficile]|uniref:DUF6765 family protein n=1 Tax=Clostridioides difficile TaxID=1496 RepID=UPI00017F5BB9|nr:DUF6765 family protein [Clostridioides difficile]
MNLDFHYYGTYLAAKVAGYNDTDAKTIAYAAQYVDESDKSMILDDVNFTLPTIQTNLEFKNIMQIWLHGVINGISRV